MLQQTPQYTYILTEVCAGNDPFGRRALQIFYPSLMCFDFTFRWRNFSPIFLLVFSVAQEGPSHS